MRASPSALPRLEACPASDLLPQFGSTAPAALRGNAIHAFLCALANGMGKDIALLMLPEEWRESADRVDLSALPKLDPSTGVAELAIAWNTATGDVRELARGGKLTREEIRALARDGEMVGIFDWVCLTEAAVIVVDWKTGYLAVDRAAVNWQVGAGAVMAAKLFGRDRAEVVISYVHDNGTWHDRASLDAMDLCDIEMRIRKLLARLEANEAAFHQFDVLPRIEEGSHCRFCPALRTCPAKVALVQSLISPKGEAPALFAKLPVPLSNENAAKLWPKLAMAIDVIETMKKSIREIAAREPLILPNGKLLALVDKSSSTILPDVAKTLLSPEMFEEVVNREETITKKAVNEAIKKRKAPEEKITHLEKKFYEDLDKVGGLKRSFWKSIEEVSPASKKLAASNPDKAA